jgi:hypothetical protein
MLQDVCPTLFAGACAAFRISVARLSSWFSRSSSLTRARSTAVTPDRRPPLISAQRTHLRSVWEVMPNFDATELIAAHWESYSPSCSGTIRTARSWTLTSLMMSWLHPLKGRSLKQTRCGSHIFLDPQEETPGSTFPGRTHRTRSHGACTRGASDRRSPRPDQATISRTVRRTSAPTIAAIPSASLMSGRSPN